MKGAWNKWKMKMDTRYAIIMLSHCEVLMHIHCMHARFAWNNVSLLK